MNYKYNIKYFTSKTWPIPVASAMMLIGLLPAVLQIMGVGRMFITSSGIIVAFAGAVILSFALGGKTSDAEFAEQIERHTSGMQDAALKKLGLEDKHVKVIPLFDPCVIGEYDFSGSEELLARRGNDGKIRSTFYSQTLLLFTAEKLCLYRNRFSFIGDYDETFLDVIPYTAIDSVYITDHEYKTVVNKKKLTVKYVIFNIKDNKGTVYSHPAHNDADLDKLVDNITKLADKKKKEADESK
ncbi:MAG: hypothetical protein PHZ09_05575 [Eubacteriales bacterium]|nr:hypothetical protein [Eubacteriales bacterium]